MLDFNGISGKNVVVIGLARSGVAAARLLSAAGARVIINDNKPAAELGPDIEALAGLPGITMVLGSHPAGIVDRDVALLVKNPGVPMNLPPLQRARELGLPVITEVELAAWKIPAPIVAITGTNGKTTTTALTGEMYKISGRRTFVAGNIGLPLSSVALEAKPEDVIVAELSSFQLEGTVSFRPHICAILNITPDHMDRHGTLLAYRQAKARIFANQTAEDAVILNADDPETFDLHDCPASRVYLFSRRREVRNGAFVRDGMLTLRGRETEECVCAVKDIVIPGAHNLENALAASLLAWLGGVRPSDIGSALKTFKGVPHRLEFAGSIGGVTFINDSKGTNTDAAVKALEAFPGYKVLIAGGYDKGGSFDNLALEIKKHVSFAVLIGQVRERLAASLQSVGFTSYEFAESLDEATGKALRAASPGQVVLLSPACASWDMFKNYEERGELFKEAVLRLGGRVNGQKQGT